MKRSTMLCLMLMSFLSFATKTLAASPFTAFVNSKQPFLQPFAAFLTHPIVVTALLTIAAICIVLELFSVGFGLASFISTTAFALFFYGHIAEGLASYSLLLLFVLGLLFAVAELFVPGGILGAIGGMMILASLLFSASNMVHMAFSILFALLMAILGVVILMKFFGKKLHVLNKLVLTDATTTEEGYVSNVNRTELLGKIGVTMTQMRPAGVVMIDEERIDAVSEGSYIDVDKKIEVIKVEGSRIVVRQI